MTTEQVARAVVRAIRRDLPEVLVTPGPIRLLLALNVLAPGLINALLKRLGVIEYHRGLADWQGGFR